MTGTQYLFGWAAYLIGATGCMISLWLISRKLPTRLKRIILMGAAILLYMPWWTNPAINYLAPAFLTAIYDGLGQGVDAMERAGLAVAAAFAGAILVAICIPVKKTVASEKKTTTNKQNQRPARKEPTC